MASPVAHLEILGPRAILDRWLGAVQDHGGCHLADALAGLESEEGIGRPALSEAERAGAARRNEAAHALGAVEAVLPPPAREEDPSERPDWAVGGWGAGERDLEALHEEAIQRASALRAAMVEFARRDEAARLLGLQRALAVVPEGRRGFAFAAGTGAGRRLRRFLAGHGARSTLVEAGGEVLTAWATLAPSVERAAGDEAARLGGRPVSLPPELAERPRPEIVAALDERLRGARGEREAARAALDGTVAEHGARARLLLDGLRDAEARAAARDRLAATAHVAAARLFVRREEAAALRRRLSVAFGSEVVVRELGEAPDAPVLPRVVAPTPFAALEGLAPARFGEVPWPALLALAVPPIVGVLWGDLVGGVLLMLAGAALGLGAPFGAPRRDTSLLAQVAGLASLLVGALWGRALGPAGARWLGDGWGLLGAGGGVAALDAPGILRGVIGALGGAALLLAAWGCVAVVAGARARRGLAVRAASLAVLHLLVVAGLAGAALGGAGGVGGALRHGWILAGAAAAAAALLAGVRAGWGRLLLDLVGLLRLAAVAVAALLLFRWGFAALLSPVPAHLLLVPAALGVGALAALVEPAHVAMGVPYDLSLGTRGPRAPFRPFARSHRPRRGEAPR